MRGLPEVLATVDGSMLTGHINMDDVKSKNGIGEWEPGVYDADVIFSYPEGVYSSGVVTSTSITVQPGGIPPVVIGGAEEPAEADSYSEPDAAEQVR